MLAMEHIVLKTSHRILHCISIPPNKLRKISQAFTISLESLKLCIVCGGHVI
jgi:hypothetical protein